MFNGDMSFKIEGQLVAIKIEYSPKEDLAEEQKEDVETFLKNNPEPLGFEPIIHKYANDTAYLAGEHNYANVSHCEDTSSSGEEEVVENKPEYPFEEIPPQVVLGKTAQGRKFFATVKNNNQYDLELLIIGDELKGNVPKTCGLDLERLQHVIETYLMGNVYISSRKDVNEAEIVVDQLLRVATLRPTVMGRRLLFTKIVIDERALKSASEIYPPVVTGRVVKTGSKVAFKHIPELLLRSVAAIEVGDTWVENNFLHIHKQEINGVDGKTRVSIALNIENIPLLDCAENVNAEYELVYRCIACDATYDTGEGLKLHLEADCKDVDNVVNMDIHNSNNFYSAVFVGKGREYMCNQCLYIFPELSGCLDHVIKKCLMDASDGNKRGQKRILLNQKMYDTKFQSPPKRTVKKGVNKLRCHCQ